MLLDLPRLRRTVDRRFPPRAGEHPLILRIEHALASYVRGQAALSLIIGVSAGIGLWVLGASASLPQGQRTPCSSAAGWRSPRSSRTSARGSGRSRRSSTRSSCTRSRPLWVALLFLGIHQVEGHIVVPNVMGNALRLHPLLVIFGLAAGAEIYGLPGALIALPLLASCRAVWEFFVDRDPLRAVVDREPVAGRDRARRADRRGERPQVTLLPARGVARASAAAWRCARPTSTSSRERSSRSSGRTAPASRRCSRSSPARWRRRAGTVERHAARRLGAAARRRTTGG